MSRKAPNSRRSGKQTRKQTAKQTPKQSSAREGKEGKPGGRPGGLALNLALALLSTLLVLGAAEISLRVLDVATRGEAYRTVELQQDGHFVPAGYWGTGPTKRQDPFAPEIRKGSYRPFLTFRFVYASDPRGVFDEDGGVVNHINRHGCRGATFPEKKPAGTLRVLGIGDSYTFGEGVKDDETFLARLQGLINGDATARHGGEGGPGAAEVLNCGVSGYNTGEEVLMLERRYLDFEPDLVLLTFVINDAYDESVFAPLHRGLLEGAGVIPEGGERASGSRRPGSKGTSKERPPSWSRLLDFLSYRLDRWRLARSTTETYLAQFTDSPALEGYNWSDCKRALAQAKALTEARGARLALVIFPELFRLDDDYPFSAIHKTVRDEAARLGIPALDLFESYRGREASDLWVHPTDHHPNEVAHDIAARAIHAFLRHEQLLPQAKGP